MLRLSQFRLQPPKCPRLASSESELARCFTPTRLLGLLRKVVFSAAEINNACCHFFSFPAVACLPSSWWYPPPSFLAMWPYHLSRICLRKVIRSMLDSLQMSSFLMWSFLVLPLADLSILISVVCSVCVSVF